MITEVKFHTDSRRSLERWYRNLDGEDRPYWAAFFRDDMISHLRSWHGEIPEAIEEPGHKPRVFWWEITPGV